MVIDFQLPLALDLEELTGCGGISLVCVFRGTIRGRMDAAHIIALNSGGSFRNRGNVVGVSFVVNVWSDRVDRGIGDLDVSSVVLLDVSRSVVGGVDM